MGIGSDASEFSSPIFGISGGTLKTRPGQNLVYGWTARGLLMWYKDFQFETDTGNGGIRLTSCVTLSVSQSVSQLISQLISQSVFCINRTGPIVAVQPKTIATKLNMTHSPLSYYCCCRCCCFATAWLGAWFNCWIYFLTPYFTSNREWHSVILIKLKWLYAP